MKTFYSMLQVSTRRPGQEIVSLGLLLIGDTESYFRYSTRKLEFLKKLIPENSFAFLRSYLYGLAETMRSEHPVIQSQFKSADFVRYLSRYNNNLVTFTKATPIDLEVNESTYRLLFEKFVSLYDESAISEASVAGTVSLQKRLKEGIGPEN